MCIDDSWRQALIICSTLWRSGPVPQWITCCLVRLTLPDTCMCVLGQLVYQLNVLRFRAVLSAVLVHWGGGGGGQDISQARQAFSEARGHYRLVHSLHQRCRGAQAAKSSPYCAYSPHLRSLCCAVHSGPPVQPFLYKKLQNSILQREKNRDKQWVGGRRRNSIKNTEHTDSKCNITTAAEQRRS